MTTIGYARVSTDGQTLDAQHAVLREAGCERIFSEKESGARTDRQQLVRAIAALMAGDTLIVTKLDRLARRHQGFAQHPRRNRQRWGNI